jgi:sugar phosphate isomerase/epimerase
MKLAFYTSLFGDRPLAEVAEWAASAGFDALELDAGKHIGDPARAAESIDTVRRAGLEVCTLTSFGSLLEPDPAARERNRATATALVDAAVEHGVPLVCTFPGRDSAIAEEENYRQLADYYTPLARRAARGNVAVILENWPGPRGDYVATTPAGWARLFELAPEANLGLNFDPSHLIRQGIEIDAALRAVAGRVFLAHAKDTEIMAERLQQTGYAGSGWWTYRLPGHGRIDWRHWLGLLRSVGFDGVVSIEHEDRDWGWPGGPLERRREGLLEARRALREAMPA